MFMWKQVGHLSVLLAGFMLFCSVSEAKDWADLSEAEMNAITAQSKDSFRSTFIGDVCVSGNIVDGSANPLADVRFSVYILSSEEERYATNVTGSFFLSVTNCSEVRLRFSKDGYDDAAYRYSIGRDVSMNASGRRVVSNSSMSVVLHEVGLTTELLSFEDMAVFSLTESSWGVSISSQDMQRVRIDNITNSAQLAEGTCYLLSDWDEEDHAIALTNVHAAVTNSSGRVLAFNRDVPKGVHLEVLGVGSGFAPYEPDNIRRPFDDVLNDMVLAPVQGYTNALAVPSYLPKAYFYFKIQGLYGKGFVTAVSETREEGKEVSAFLILRLQPDGTRNLRTAR